MNAREQDALKGQLQFLRSAILHEVSADVASGLDGFDRLIDQLGRNEDQRTIGDWQKEKFGNQDPGVLVGRALLELAELVGAMDDPTTPTIDYRAMELDLRPFANQLIAVGSERPKSKLPVLDMADEIADVVILMNGLADELGLDLESIVTQKMAKNRTRNWNGATKA